MQLQRYTKQELQEICANIFYDYLSSPSEVSPNETNAHILYLNHVDTLEMYKKKIRMYEETLSKDVETECKHSLKKQLDYLKMGYDYIISSNIQNQKRIYETTGSTDFCRSSVRIPLDKKINSYYDDITLEVVFYDDVTTLNGKFEAYNKLLSKEEREEFIMRNTEITHMGLALITDQKLVSIIALQGQLNVADPRVQNSGVILLPEQFSDFNSVNLKMISNIASDNNDFKQWLQSKIDLDKEDLEELSSLVIRGDLYKIYKTKGKGNETFYIRYICRSTGRVYYNELSLENLRLSQFFDYDDYDSYSKAWWNLNTLGGNPDEDKPVIRC